MNTLKLFPTLVCSCYKTCFFAQYNY